MKKYLYRSVFLHIAVFLIFVIDLPVFFKPKMTIGQAPIIVDLKDVKLGEMTNLPPKAVFGEEEKKATVAEKTPPKYTKEAPAPKPEPKPEIKEPEAPKTDFADTNLKPESQKDKRPEPKPEPKPTPKPTPKPAPVPPKKPTPKPSPKPAEKTPPKPAPKETPKKEIKTMTNPLKSLLDSADAIGKELAQENSPAVIKTGTEVANMGVEGGTGGSYLSDLTITKTDAIASYIRDCWIVDPGAQNIENMLIEIRVYLTKEGTVRSAEIINKSLKNNPVAESALRAVYTAQNHKNINAYKILAEEYPDKYKMWNTLLLKFNPMDGSIH